MKVSAYVHGQKFRASYSLDSINQKKRQMEADYSFWLTFSLIFLCGFMICLVVNLRAHSDLKHELGRYEILSQQAEVLRQKNMELADEVKMLKTDLSAIEHEARKLGMIKPNEKILVSGR